MQNKLNRAVQFMPFDALSGFRQMLNQVAMAKVEKKSFEEDFYALLNATLTQLKKGDSVRVTYYYGVEYLQIIGIVKRVDSIHQKIYICHTVIPFDDILEIEIL